MSLIINCDAIAPTINPIILVKIFIPVTPSKLFIIDAYLKIKNTTIEDITIAIDINELDIKNE